MGTLHPPGTERLLTLLRRVRRRAGGASRLHLAASGFAPPVMLAMLTMTLGLRCCCRCRRCRLVAGVRVLREDEAAKAQNKNERQCHSKFIPHLSNLLLNVQPWRGTLVCDQRTAFGFKLDEQAVQAFCPVADPAFVRMTTRATLVPTLEQREAQNFRRIFTDRPYKWRRRLWQICGPSKAATA